MASGTVGSPGCGVIVCNGGDVRQRPRHMDGRIGTIETFVRKGGVPVREPDATARR